MQRVAGKVRSITGQLDKNAGNDKVVTGVNIVLASCFLLKYARLKYALEQASILRAQCKV
jgi:hypothetical protein